MSVDAGLVLGAFAVRTATEHRQAFDVGVADEAARAATRDAMIDGHTFGVFAARVLVAGADAAPVEAVAEEMRRTVDVVVADVGGMVDDWWRVENCVKGCRHEVRIMCRIGTWLTAHITVALITGRTLAIGAVVDVNALRIHSARIVNGARRSAHLTDAGLVLRALIIRCAFH